MKTITTDLSTSWEIACALMLATVLVAMPDMAFALSAAGEGTDTLAGNVLCVAVNFFQGSAGKGLATIMVCALGVGAMLGKVSWGMAAMLGTGVGIVFGAWSIVNNMGASLMSVDCTGEGSTVSNQTADPGR